MKRLLIRNMPYILLVFLLVGCESTSSSNPNTEPQRPSYLTVFQQFQKTPLFEKCEKFEENIRRSPHKAYRIMPSYITSDMEIDKSTALNGVYTANISCKVRVTYSFNATTYVKEEQVLSLGELSFEY